MAKERNIPTFMDEGPTVVRSIRMDRDLYLALAEFFKEDDRSFSYGAQKILREFAQGKGLIK